MSEQQQPQQRQKRLAIIGCGPSAISTLITLVKAEQQQQQNIPEIVCFEKQESMGGQWIYTWRTDVDKYGVPISNSCLLYTSPSPRDRG